MKNFKKLTAAVAATLMAATMVAPMAMNSFALEVASFTDSDSDGLDDVTGFDETKHGAYVTWAADKDEKSGTTAKYDEYLAAQTSAFDGKAFKLEIPENSNIDTISAVSAYKIFAIKKEAAGGYSADETEWANDIIKNTVCTAIGNPDETPQEAMAAICETDFNAEGLAKKLAVAISTANKTNQDAVPAVECSWANSKLTFKENPANGYYIVLATGTKNNEDGTDDDETTESLGMLTIIDGEKSDIGTNGNAKMGLPKVEKKVLEDDTDNVAASEATYESDKHWNDVADLEIGQTAKFRLYGTLPDNYDKYDVYKYVFHDTLSKGFATVAADDITVKYYADAATAKADTAGTGGTPMTVTPTIVTDDNTGVQTITVGWDDLTTVKGLTNESVIVVEYTTVLTKDAIVATTGGQDNKVNLEYSRNPNQENGGDTDTTPDDKVIVYTYDLEIDKTFFAGSDLTQEEVKNETYDDFKFSIEGKTVRPVTSSDTDLWGKYDYVVDDTVDTTDMTLSVYKTNAQGKDEKVDTSITGWYNEGETYTLKIKVKGLDSDVYTVKEDQTVRNNKADGSQKYNDVEDKTAEITSFEGTDTPIYSQDKTLFGSLTVKLNGTANGTVDIENRAGTELPSTGGMGTKLFYLGGGAMVAVAGIFLITKKRMKKEEV